MKKKYVLKTVICSYNLIYFAMITVTSYANNTEHLLGVTNVAPTHSQNINFWIDDFLNNVEKDIMKLDENLRENKSSSSEIMYIEKKTDRIFYNESDTYKLFHQHFKNKQVVYALNTSKKNLTNTINYSKDNWYADAMDSRYHLTVKTNTNDINLRRYDKWFALIMFLILAVFVSNFITN